jgi:hypothetical protein
VTYRQFSDVAKKAFIHEAYDETDDRGRRINTSRVAVRTGLSRKEIRRVVLSDQAAGQRSNSPVDHAGPPARVLHAWHSRAEFLDDTGEPLDLPFESDGICFVDLARSFAGDVPPGAVRVELKRAGAVIELDDGRLRPIKRYFVPKDFDEKAITVLSGMLFPLAAGIEYNASPTRSPEGFIQRFAFSDHIDPALIPVFRKWSRLQATTFVESMNEWLAANESAEIATDANGQPTRTGIGVFYYEGPSADSISGSTLGDEPDGTSG